MPGLAGKRWPVNAPFKLGSRPIAGHTGVSHALHSIWKALAPQPESLTRTGVRPYALAVVATLASIAITRLTWPLFSGTPFVPLFGAVVVTTQWGNGPAGL